MVLAHSLISHGFFLTLNSFSFDFLIGAAVKRFQRLVTHFVHAELLVASEEAWTVLMERVGMVTVETSLTEPSAASEVLRSASPLVELWLVPSDMMWRWAAPELFVVPGWIPSRVASVIVVRSCKPWINVSGRWSSESSSLLGWRHEFVD